MAETVSNAHALFAWEHQTDLGVFNTPVLQFKYSTVIQMSKAKAKGTSAERAVVDMLIEHGYVHAERRALNGANDKGDIAGIPFVCIEVKNQAQMQLATWVDELETEIANAKAQTGVLIHKRRGKGQPYNWYATMPVYIWLDLLDHWTGLNDE